MLLVNNNLWEVGVVNWRGLYCVITVEFQVALVSVISETGNGSFGLQMHFTLS